MRGTGSAAPSTSHSHRSRTQLAGRRPHSFLGHPAQLFGEEADKKGVFDEDIVAESILEAGVAGLP